MRASEYDCGGVLSIDMRFLDLVLCPPLVGALYCFALRCSLDGFSLENMVRHDVKDLGMVMYRFLRRLSFPMPKSEIHTTLNLPCCWMRSILR